MPEKIFASSGERRTFWLRAALACGVLWCAQLVSLASVAAWAAEPRPGKAAVASAHPLADAAGREILDAGGNAFDAAVAVSAALSVLEPNSSGLGGGGFYLLHRASDGLDTMIDAREKAPGASTRDMYLDAAGNAVPGLSTEGALAAGIPGEPAGLALLAQKYGKLPLARSLAPAIRLARDGFPLYPRLLGAVRARTDTLRRLPETSRSFLDNGAVPKIGRIIRQPEAARSYELFAREGMQAFYTGPFAKRLVTGVRKLGGIWTEQDLADYRAIERAPIIGHYRGATIISGSPPTSGGVALIDALNILSGFDLQHVDSATRKHLVIEAMRRVHRDRAVYMGDPDFVKMPIERLISPYYADGQRTSIRLDRATPSASLPGVDSEARGNQTTHFSILDADGNRVAATITINLFFGSGVVIPGTGIFLNDEMDDFSIKPGQPNAFQLIGAEANAILPGKRPLSSSTPTFVESDRGVMITGSPGGSRIIGMVLLATLNYMDGMSAKEIAAAPRFHHQFSPDVVLYENNALTAEERAALEKRGHTLRQGSAWGNLQTVIWDRQKNTVEAASDPRGDGEGLVY